MQTRFSGRDRRTRIASALMATAGISAVAAFAGALFSEGDATGNARLAEMWWMWGLLVFAGLFFLLAWRPWGFPGVWEIAFLHKVAVCITALTLRGPDVDQAGQVALVDGALAVVIAVSYVLARGYEGWRKVG